MQDAGVARAVLQLRVQPRSRITWGQKPSGPASAARLATSAGQMRLRTALGPPALRAR